MYNTTAYHSLQAVTKLESVLVWNFKTGRLVGGAKAFRKQVKEKYNVEPSVSWSQCQEIANENMQLFIGQQSFIKQQEFLKQNKCLSLAIAGPPCTEVSTYAQLLCKDFGAKLLRPAAVIEKHMNDGTLLGRAANLKVERGLEVPHTLLAQMYIEEIKSSECRRNGFVMDGFPFTKEQALQLEAAGVEVEVFIKLSLGDSAILEKANEQKLNVNDVVAQLRTFNENIVGTSSVYQEVMFEVGVAGDQKSIYQQILQQTREQLGFEL